MDIITGKSEFIISMDDLSALCGLAGLRLEMIGDGADIEDAAGDTIIHLPFAEE